MPLTRQTLTIPLDTFLCDPSIQPRQARRTSRARRGGGAQCLLPQARRRAPGRDRPTQVPEPGGDPLPRQSRLVQGVEET